MHIGAEMLGADIFLPLAITHTNGQFNHAPGAGQNQGKASVGRGFGEYVGCVGEQDLACIEVLEVIVVDAHGHAGNGLKLGGKVQQLRIQLQACSQ